MTTTDPISPNLAETMARLRGAQKGHARGAPAYSVYVNRRIGRLFAAVAYRLGLTPNRVTLVSAAHTFVGVALIATVPPSWWSGILTAVLLVAGYAWDSADGQVARLRGGGSVAGEWLDHFVDALKIASLHLAVLVGLYRFGDLGEFALLIPIGYSVVATVTFFGMILNDLLKGARGVASTHARAGGTFGRSMILLPTDFGVLCLAFLLWGVSPLFLAVYGALFAVNALFLGAATVKWFREMRRVG
ncbi:CDP-alcohol phosphatidyltransferase [Microbacterium sp. LKL04]|uniref:CDP-alcohol phosphatidyltransferase family protein n=1 Tax=Microbacterium sp. LKL04 TaxID=912630 RepID=UPI000875AD89|nr:CDP-alcohol phosphatidyltransferase family protein [Microbacterium sp. LKL04]SCY63257.1 CDP-alcohol phosphatidyltransferase [Microbacterium sp. LKL04]